MQQEIRSEAEELNQHTLLEGKDNGAMIKRLNQAFGAFEEDLNKLEAGCSWDVEVFPM